MAYVVSGYWAAGYAAGEVGGDATASGASLSGGSSLVPGQASGSPLTDSQKIDILYQAYTTGALSPSAESIAAAILAAAQITPIHANVKQVNSVTIQGSGVAGDSMRPV